MGAERTEGQVTDEENRIVFVTTNCVRGLVGDS